MRLRPARGGVPFYWSAGHSANRAPHSVSTLSEFGNRPWGLRSLSSFPSFSYSLDIRSNARVPWFEEARDFEAGVGYYWS